jgi:nascent polypeptide-associated complex subunit alpha
VYKSPSADSFVVFGDARIEDTNQLQQAAAAAKLDQANNAAGAAMPSTAIPAAKKPAAAADEEDGEVDEEGIEAKDIELVMTQANVSRAAAVKAIRNNNGDMINAIMELSM